MRKHQENIPYKRTKSSQVLSRALHIFCEDSIFLKYTGDHTLDRSETKWGRFSVTHNVKIHRPIHLGTFVYLCC